MYRSFRDMPVWQLAMEIAVKVHALTDSLPRKEDYGLTSQIRRSALSISANIAEGFGRKHVLDKINFYLHSRGSLTETQSHLEYGFRVGYLQKEEVELLDSQLLCLHHDLNKLIAGMSLRSVK
ncbi:MAG: four helix bundle protein [Geobacteraceae bacterium GWB2_52_12]|nr:MAG: four helix bundle protein [Geobacteraceae bacterium GWB2_52_12]